MNLLEPSQSGSKGPRIFSVIELTIMIKSMIEDEFPNVWVRGEISGFKRATSGHCYFNLKERAGTKEAIISGVMWRGSSSKLRFEPEDGLEVIGQGKLSVYEPRGSYQIVIDKMEPAGLGALQLAFEQLKEKLHKEGLFNEEHKKPIPAFPRTIGVVTSRTGAAIRDIINVIHRRFPGIQLILAPVRVQGEGSAAEVTAAIETFNKAYPVDVMIVGRGGGSLEDLWAFNEEIVARAIFNSKIPIISAVGHEVDFTIADFVADQRAPTPSAAAELVVSERSQLIKNVKDMVLRLKQAFRTNLMDNRHTLQNLREKLRYHSPERILERYRQNVDDLEYRMQGKINNSLNLHKERINNLRQQLAARHPGRMIMLKNQKLTELDRIISGNMKIRISREQDSLNRLIKHMKALDPSAILRRGYSIVTSEKSKQIIKSAGDVAPGDRISIKLHEGGIKGQVTESDTKKKPDKPKKSESGPDEMTLFS